jgi:hypothetical protein
MSSQAESAITRLHSARRQRQNARNTVANYAELLDTVASALNETRGIWFIPEDGQKRVSFPEALNQLPSANDIIVALAALEEANARVTELEDQHKD